MTLEEEEKEKERYELFKGIYSCDFKGLLNDVFASERGEVKNTNAYLSYLNLVKRTAKVIKELGIVDPFRASVAFEYLLWNGYMSKDKVLEYSPSSRANIASFLAADIMRGKSVCLNNAEMQANVLQEMGTEAYAIGCIFPVNVNPNERYRPNIQRMTGETKSSKKLKDKLLTMAADVAPLLHLGNHAVTLFKNDNGYFISDPTNLDFLNITSFLRANYIFLDGVTIEIKPFLTLTNGTITPMRFDEVYDELYAQHDTKSISFEQAKDLVEDSLATIEENQRLLDDFYIDNQSDINDVCEYLNTKKKHKTKKKKPNFKR